MHALNRHLLRTASILLLVLLVATTCAIAPAAAAKKVSISGTIPRGKGYTVVATTATGGGVRQKLGASGKFRLQLTAAQAKGATLSLITPQGRFFGPVVLATARFKAYTRLTGRSVVLGKLKLGAGYAMPAAKLPKRAVSGSWVAANAKGRPVGAGKLGFVKRAPGIKLVAKAGPQTSGNGADTDTDGIPNNFDVDDDGDQTLDASDADSGSGNNDPVKVFTNLKVGLIDTVNVNATSGAALAEAQERLITDHLWMTFMFAGWAAKLSGVTGVNVDCGTLSYCAPKAGTATIVSSPNPRPNEPAPGSLWSAWDTDSDTLPNLVDTSDRFGPDQTGMWQMGVNTKAPRAKVNAGDAFLFNAKSSAGVATFATTLPPYFVTTPAIKSIEHGAATHTVTYPVTAAEPGVGGGLPGGSTTPTLALTSDVVTFTVWRPQRQAIPGAETGAFRDLGQLSYLVMAGNATCTADDITAVSDGLVEGSDGFYSLVKDTAADAAPDPANVLRITVNLGTCFARDTNPGAQSRSTGFNVGIEARTERGDNAGTSLWVTLP